MVKRKIKIVKSLFLFTGIVLLMPVIHADYPANGIPYIRNYQQQEMVNVTQTWAIIQAENGIIYTGNGYGFSEFDGREWRWFRIKNNSGVYSLFEDSCGTIYGGGINEFGFLHANNDGFSTYVSLLDKVPAANRKFDVIWQIARFDGIIAFLSEYAIFLYNGQNIKVLETSTKFNRMLVLNNDLYVFEGGGALKIFNKNTGALEIREKFYSLSDVITMVPWKGKGILFCDRYGSLFSWENYILNEIKSPATAQIKKARPYCMSVINDSTYAVGTTLDGFMVFDNNGRLHKHINRGHGLDHNKIYSIGSDHSGNIWVGHENGVSYIELNSPIQYIPWHVISGSGYTAAAFGGKHFLGTNEGLHMADITTQQSGGSLQNVKKVPGTEGQVWNISAHNGELLINQYNGLKSLKNNTVREITQGPGSWKTAEIPGMPDMLLQGTYEGLALLKKQNGQWVFYKKIEGFDISSRVFEIDADQVVWVTHVYKGVYKLRFNKNFEKISSVRFMGAEQGFPGNLGIHVTKINNRILFTSDLGGIFAYNTQKDSFELSNMLEAHLGAKPKISKLYQDNDGRVWFVSLDKMGVLQPKANAGYQLISQPFGSLQKKLITSFELIYPCGNNQVLFGVSNGFVLYNMNLNKNYALAFNTLIRNVELIGYTDTSIYGGQICIDKRKPEISHKNNSVRFSFAAPFYEQNEAIRYSYFLEGFDDGWSRPATTTSKEYLKLPGGGYTFRVKSVNIYGIEGSEAIFEFYVHPHFTRTWWAYFIYLLLGAGAILAFIYIYTHNRVKKHRRIALQREKEIIELKHQKLLNEFDHKNAELSTLTLQVVKKNDLLNEIKLRLMNMLEKQSMDPRRELNSVIRTLERETNEDNDWEAIELYFNNVYKGFLKKLKERYPNLRSTELKLCAYIRMDLSNKEISALMNNTIRGVEAYRYRLRKSLDLKRDESLKEFLFDFQ